MNLLSAEIVQALQDGEYSKAVQVCIASLSADMRPAELKMSNVYVFEYQPRYAIKIYANGKLTHWCADGVQTHHQFHGHGAMDCIVIDLMGAKQA